MSVFVIAEAGVNHNGSTRLAMRLVDIAREAGADAVKFQTFKTDSVVTRSAPKADYQKRAPGTGKSQWEMIRKLELDERAHRKLAAHCRKRGIEFMSTPFDEASVDLLVHGLGVRRLKIPSGEITNAPLLLKIARTRLPLIVSTGMADLREVHRALEVIAFGWAGRGKPSPQAFRAAYRMSAAQKLLKSKLILLHCTTAYPVPYDDVNLRAMDALSNAFGIPTGYSDHTLGTAVAVAAAARGARVIEKHFTIDKKMNGPDHQASLDPGQLADMVASIRQVEKALGDGRKKAMPSEIKNRAIVRRSLVAARAIRAGEVIREGDLTAKRPASGLSPFRYWEMIGKKAARSWGPDEILTR